MDEVIIRVLQGASTPAEEDRLARWRRESLANERRYRDSARLWELVGSLEADDEKSAVPTLRELLDTRMVGSRGPRIPGWRPSYWIPRAAAAAVLIALGAAGSSLVGSGPAPQPFGATELVTGASELVTTRLADGSIVRLAPHSRLRVSAMPGARELWLEGRAFFAVAHDAARPFTVRTRAGDALVLGTRFEVRVDDDDLQVVVLEGKVALNAGGERVEVNAGEMSRAVDGATPAVVAVGDVRPMLDWMGRFLVFENTPLRSAASEIEKRYGVRVDIADQATANRTVTAWFSDQTIEEVLMVICRIVDARCSIADGVVNIRPG